MVGNLRRKRQADAVALAGQRVNGAHFCAASMSQGDASLWRELRAVILYTPPPGSPMAPESLPSCAGIIITAERDYASNREQALASCMLDADGQSWRVLSARTNSANRLDIACGLPVYVYSVATRQGQGSAFARIDAFYDLIRQGAQPDFTPALDCGAAAATCASPRTARLLDGTGPMEQQWDAILRARWKSGCPPIALASSMSCRSRWLDG
ncbi:hypothetical protein ACFOY5_13200 [Massilia aurea]|uniref:hypothetical protein n=1 Tax=Massilia aurea TaxID=373040 RepID=UPI0021622EC2|nr:hypothetical protein [Massilia aurea]MCS0705719.1 hypothetical protein [Massilia aurea]